MAVCSILPNGSVCRGKRRSMWLVFGIGAIAGLIGWAIGSSKAPSPQRNITSGAPPSAVDTLALCLENRQPFPPELVQAAMDECYYAGDLATLDALQRSFPQPQAEAKKTVQAPAMPVIQAKSPLYNVDDAEWSQFVSTMATEPPTFKDDSHVGRFRHHKRRLQELGIDPDTLDTEQAQYDALSTDMQDSMMRYGKLVNDFSGDVITINGQTTPITRSGILMLLKCAGPDGALSWLTDESERLRYPNTTQKFLSANAVF